MMRQSLSVMRHNVIIQLIILLEGFVTISLEILTIRQLIPVAGNSVIVTSLIIGVFLLFLAYGYRKGGSYTADFLAVLKYNFILAALGLGIGVSYLFIKSFFLLVMQITGGNIFITLLLYLLLITAPLVYLLGQTVPITLNLYKEQQTIGAAGGKVLHLSTLGSFLGAVLTSLLLMNYLGVAWTVFINYIILALLIVLLAQFPKDSVQIAVLALAGVLIYIVNIHAERKQFLLTDSYNNYQLVKHADANMLFINDSASSSINTDLQGFPYIEYIKTILFHDLKLRNKSILILGAGGFSLSAANTYGNHFTYVDIDPNIRDVVQQHFLANINGDFIAADARQFLNKKGHTYDVIVGDTYSSQTAIPAHLLTQEYFASVYQALNRPSIAIFNIIAHPTLADAYSKRVDNTIRSVFKNCMVMPLPYTAQSANIIYLCTKSLNEGDTMIYRDNKNRATLDYFTF